MGSASPTDPLWATFRELRRDATLVLLPAPPLGLRADADSSGAPASPPASVDDVRAAGWALRARVDDLITAWGVTDSPELGWHSEGNDRVRACVSFRGGLPDCPPVEHLASGLTQQRWESRVRSARPAVCVDGACADSTIVVMATAGTLVVRAESVAFSVTEPTAHELVRATDG